MIAARPDVDRPSYQDVLVQRASFDRQIARSEMVRARFQLATQVLSDATRLFTMSSGYDNAGTSRLWPDPPAPGGSVHRHLSPRTHDALRRRSQDAARNNPLARSLVARLRDLIAAGRTQLQMKSGDEAYNAQVEARWAEYGESEADFMGLSPMGALLDAVQEAMAVDGDIGINLVDDGGVGRIQLIASERVTGGRSIDLVDGVKFDSFGRPIAFQVCNWNQFGGIDYASAREIDPRYFILARSPRHIRPDQVRGEPLLSGSLDKLNQIDECDASVLVALRMCACAPVFIKSADPAQRQADMLNIRGENGQAARDDDQSQNTTFWRPGGMMHLGLNEDFGTVPVQFPGETYLPFIATLISRIGADIGLPIEAWLYDTTQTTFYGGKAAAAFAYHGTVSTWQSAHRSILNRIFSWWMDLEISAGRLPDHKDRRKFEWIFAAPPQFDEKDAVESAVLRIASGLSNYQRECARLGIDFTDNTNILARELKARREAGLPDPQLPGASAPRPLRDQGGDPLTKSKPVSRAFLARALRRLKGTP